MSQSEVELAEELMRKGRYPEATERLRALLSVDPENAGVRARCGEAYRLSGNNERAFHHYNKAAAIYLRNADATGALRMLQFANAVSPNEPEVLFRMAECLKALGEHQGMEPVLLQIIAVAKGTGDRRKLWALEELALRYPDDMDVCARRAEALSEAGRIDDAVAAWKKVSAWLDQRGIDFVPMLQRAASIAPDRADVGVDLANILLANRRAREALILLVPFYEKFPDDVGVLDTLLRALEALGATDKITPARIELIKARAKRGMRDGTMREIQILMQAAPEDISALEVCAHACTAFGETAQAIAVWRKLAHLCDRLQKKFERDRAILMLLKANPDDEDALTLGARALREAARNEEAQVLENRLAMIRRLRLKNSSQPPAPSKSSPRGVQPPQKSASAPALAAIPPRAPAPSLSSPSSATLYAPPSKNTTNTNPFGAEDGRHAHRRPGSGATVLADETEASPKRPAARFVEQPTEERDEIDLNLFESGEYSAEKMPIARNPYVDDLYLETGPSAAQTATSHRSFTPASSAFSYTKTGASIAGASITAPSISAPAMDFDENMHTAEGDPSSGQLGTAYGELAALEEEPEEYALPIESPSSLEETTSRIAQLVSDELAELRTQFADETVRSTVLENMPVTRENVPVSAEFDVESVRPTQRLPNLSELFAELDRKKA